MSTSSDTTQFAALVSPEFCMRGAASCTATGTVAKPNAQEIRAAGVARDWMADLANSARALSPTLGTATMTGIGVAAATSNPMLAALAASTVAMTGLVSPGSTPKVAATNEAPKRG